MARRILVTGAGGAAAVSFMKAVQGCGWEIWAGDMDPYAPGLFMVPAHRRLLLPPGASRGFAFDLAELCQRHHIEIVVPTVDAELLPLARAQLDFALRGVRLLLGSPLALDLSLDKWKLFLLGNQFARFPRTICIDDTVDVGVHLEDLVPNAEQPIIVKPRKGAGGRGVRLVRSMRELLEVPRDGEWIAQEYLPGEEYSVDVLSKPGGAVLAAVPRVRERVDSGVAIVGRTLIDEGLSATAAALVTGLGLGWVSNVQLRRDREGVAKILEVNPRFPGTMSLTVAAGVNMPLLALEMLEGRLPEGPIEHRALAMVRTWTERFMTVAELDVVAIRGALARPVESAA